jgi:hypothetical protein
VGISKVHLSQYGFGFEYIRNGFPKYLTFKHTRATSLTDVGRSSYLAGSNRGTSDSVFGVKAEVILYGTPIWDAGER